MGPRIRNGAPRTLNCLAAALLAGCETAKFTSPSSVPTPSTPPARDTTSARAFPPAVAVELPAVGEVETDGSLQSQDDVAVFSLGEVHRGDRIIVDVTGNDGI